MKVHPGTTAALWYCRCRQKKGEVKPLVTFYIMRPYNLIIWIWFFCCKVKRPWQGRIGQWSPIAISALLDCRLLMYIKRGRALQQGDHMQCSSQSKKNSLSLTCFHHPPDCCDNKQEGPCHLLLARMDLVDAWEIDHRGISRILDTFWMILPHAKNSMETDTTLSREWKLISRKLQTFLFGRTTELVWTQIQLHLSCCVTSDQQTHHFPSGICTVCAVLSCPSSLCQPEGKNYTGWISQS